MSHITIVQIMPGMTGKLRAGWQRPKRGGRSAARRSAPLRPPRLLLVHKAVRIGRVASGRLDGVGRIDECVRQESRQLCGDDVRADPRDVARLTEWRRQRCRPYGRISKVVPSATIRSGAAVNVHTPMLEPQHGFVYWNAELSHACPRLRDLARLQGRKRGLETVLSDYA